MNNFFYTAIINKLRIIKNKKLFFESIYKDEWGRCANCGNFSRFKYSKLLNTNSKVVDSCGWDKKFTEEINITNTLNCSCCLAKFRVRCAAESLLKYFWQGKIKSISELINQMQEDKLTWIALETASVGGIFSDYRNLKGIVKSEYFDDVERGKSKDGVRSEDLQNLTFDANTFDAVISLDVFEHIADPWKAFSEVRRVLKPGGVGIITVPIDIRIKTTATIAKVENGEIKYFRKPAYHCDHLREEGTLVFTEFGTDIESKLREMGYNASLDVYNTQRTNATQFVILIEKSDLVNEG
jgi:hypothetical protein